MGPDFAKSSVNIEEKDLLSVFMLLLHTNGSLC